MKKLFLPAFLFLLLFTSCNKCKSFKERYTTIVDNDERDYYLHVPGNYNKNNPAPVVFMLHGIGGTGEDAYNRYGWKEVGDAEGILTVFPTSWKHCIIEAGDTLTTTRWNVYEGYFRYCDGEMPRDDVKFLRQVLTELRANYNVDTTRVYLVGFSNGAQMAFRCSVEMGDVLAAVVENAGTAPKDTSLMKQLKKRNLPIGYQFGNSDPLAFIPPVPMSDFTTVIDTLGNVVQTNTTVFEFDTTLRTIEAVTTTSSGTLDTLMMIATYLSLDVTENRPFKVVMVKGLRHMYPNGDNHELKAAEVQWQWLKQFTLQ